MEIYSFEYQGSIPTVNHYWGRTRTGKVYVTNEGKSFKEAIQYICLSKRFKPLETNIKLTINVGFTKNNRDIDNILKPLLDAMQGVCYVNDKQIVSLYIEKEISKTEYLKVTVHNV